MTSVPAGHGETSSGQLAAILKAVHDCGAIAAVWNNTGFEELRLASLVWSKPLGDGRYLHKRWSNIHKGDVK